MKFTFAPNSGSPGLLDALRAPGFWASPGVDSFELSMWNILGESGSNVPPGWYGPNSYHAIKDTGLGALPVPLILGYESAKEHDPQGIKARQGWRNMVDRVEAAGGTIGLVKLDEPMGSTIPGRFNPPSHRFPYDSSQVHIVADWTAECINHYSVPAVLYEPFPQHPVDRILAEIDLLTDRTRLLRRFVVDVDMGAVRASDDWQQAVDDLRWGCAALGIDFGIVVGHQPHHSRTSAEFIASANRWAAAVSELSDRLVFESWHERPSGVKAIPDTRAFADLLTTWDVRLNGKEPEMPDNPKVLLRMANGTYLWREPGGNIRVGQLPPQYDGKFVFEEVPVEPWPAS